MTWRSCTEKTERNRARENPMDSQMGRKAERQAGRKPHARREREAGRETETEMEAERERRGCRLCREGARRSWKGTPVPVRAHTCLIVCPNLVCTFVSLPHHGSCCVRLVLPLQTGPATGPLSRRWTSTALLAHQHTPPSTLLDSSPLRLTLLWRLLLTRLQLLRQLAQRRMWRPQWKLAPVHRKASALRAGSTHNYSQFA